ncbi:hypothetical protein E4U44_002595 [Claviceps purpurea]|nr:hypothetical protein E4U26_006337 [Claviceps purpurea]KAG6313428.1 hypothetical protein E4U44_002595 [Claviceps purpurea]
MSVLGVRAVVIIVGRHCLMAALRKLAPTLMSVPEQSTLSFTDELLESPSVRARFEI